MASSSKRDDKVVIRDMSRIKSIRHKVNLSQQLKRKVTEDGEPGYSTENSIDKETPSVSKKLPKLEHQKSQLEIKRELTTITEPDDDQKRAKT